MAKQKVKYTDEGIPIDANDWDYEDWKILWIGICAIKAAIAERHRERREAKDACP